MAVSSIMKSIAVSLGGIVAGGVFALSFAASHAVDLYAIVDQVGKTTAEISKLVAMVSPLIPLFIAAWRRRPKYMLNDLAEGGSIKGAIVPPELAKEVPSNKVVATMAELPFAAKSATGL